MATTTATRPRIERQFLRAQDIVRNTGLGKTKVYDLIATGELPSVQVGRVRLVDVEDFDRFIEERRNAPRRFA